MLGLLVVHLQDIELDMSTKQEHTIRSGFLTGDVVLKCI